jgi:hypothetical protein
LLRKEGLASLVFVLGEKSSKGKHEEEARETREKRKDGQGLTRNSSGEDM